MPIVGLEQLALVRDLVDVLPAAARVRLEDRRAADVVEQPVPVDRIDQVVQRLGRQIDVGRIALLRQQHRPRDGDAELGHHRVVEELVVGRPPERVVDDVGALQHGVLHRAAVVLDLVRDAVDDDAIARRLVHLRPAELDHLAGDAVRRAELVRRAG